ncbi:MAG: Thiopurine S-methyltransferase [Planctomycetes bacterium]|nr:Thiopurine S-methyltransferase [Planctomycetota bacterium]MCQ3948648.1 SAM-dependent methyltransferase [Planctomycetota bacterium]GIK51748.1 MAG: SAM-dependent methyltransferase [Planctomycetota bacterium]
MATDQNQESNMSEVSHSRYWNDIYSKPEDPGWTLGQAAPPLAHWLKTARPQPGRVAVLGCGYGHDTALFAQAGFDAWGYDFAPLAIERARQAGHEAGKGSLTFVQADFFDLPKTELGAFDYVYEYTSFVAIEPARRSEYATMCQAILKRGGMLVGCFYNHGRPGGPPFDTTREDVLKAFGARFDIRRLEITPHSIERRKGHELWAEMVRR